MGSKVIFSDLELFLTGRIRQALAAVPGDPYAGVFVANEFYSPDELVPRPDPPFQVVVRDDGGPRTGVNTKSVSARVTVLGSDTGNARGTAELANLVAVIVEGCPGAEPGNPVAAVTASNGPFRVPEESGRPRRYMTFTLSVTGLEYA